MHSYSTERVKVYRTFKSLDPADPLAIVGHYERNERVLSNLDLEQWFDCLATYVDALFDAEMYRKHLVMAEYLLEVIIIQNFKTHHGEDIYQHTLLRKACTHSHLGEHTKARETIESLIRINPEYKAARYVLANLLLKAQPHWYRSWTTYYIAFILASSVCFALSGVMYAAQQPYSKGLLLLGGVLLGFAVFAMITTRLWHTWQAYAYPRRLARKLLHSQRKDTDAVSAYGK